MPIDVAMEEPWAWVVCIETESHVVAGLSNIDNITPDWVGVVVCRATCNTYNIERMSMEMEWMLIKALCQQHIGVER